MRALNGTVVTAMVLITVLSPRLLSQMGKGAHSQCDAPEYFGVCDPYVPSTNIISTPQGEVRVLSTWPASPADEVGICPGDEIVSANGILASENTFPEFLKAITSQNPTPVDLKIKRGNQILDLQVPRVRESTLATLSKQKFVWLPFFPIGKRLVTVPIREGPEHLQAFRDFEFQIGAQYGFKLLGGRWVPQGTREDQLSQIKHILAEPQSARLVDNVILITDAYGAGFSVLLLKNPQEILVDLKDPASPAYEAGLFPGDSLIAVDGRSVADMDQKQLADLILKPDDRSRLVSLRIRRGRSEMNVRLETQPWHNLGYGFSVFGAAKRPPIPPGTYVVGLRVVDSDHPRQAIVSDVTYPSPAFDAGMLIGDLLVAVNGKPLEQITREQLSELLNPTSPSELSLEVSRLGRGIHFRLTPATEAEAQAEIERKMTKNGPMPIHCAELPKPRAP